MTEAAELTTTVTGPALRRAIDIFDEGARRHPDRICFRFGDESLTYREVESLSHRVAAALAADGLGRGSHAGRAERQPAECLRVRARHPSCRRRLAVDQRPQLDRREHPHARLRLRRSVLSLGVRRPGRRTTDSGRRACVAASASTNGTAQTCTVSLGLADRRTAPVPATEPGDLAMLSATGGTTGRPRGVMLTQQNFIAFCEGGLALGTGRRALGAAAPMTHVGGRFGFPVMGLGGMSSC